MINFNDLFTGLLGLVLLASGIFVLVKYVGLIMEEEKE